MSFGDQQRVEQTTSKLLCTFCREQPVYEPHPRVLPQGAALRRNAERRHELEIAADCEGFLQLMSRHPETDGLRMLPLAQYEPGGQFSLAFCSMGCLREYINGRLDLFENQLNGISRGGF